MAQISEILKQKNDIHNQYITNNLPMQNPLPKKSQRQWVLYLVIFLHLLKSICFSFLWLFFSLKYLVDDGNQNGSKRQSYNCPDTQAYELDQQTVSFVPLIVNAIKYIFRIYMIFLAKVFDPGNYLPVGSCFPSYGKRNLCSCLQLSGNISWHLCQNIGFIRKLNQIILYL